MLRAINCIVFLYLLAPIIVVIATAFGASPYPIFPPRDFTFKWFVKVWNTQELREAAFDQRVHVLAKERALRGMRCNQLLCCRCFGDWLGRDGRGFGRSAAADQQSEQNQT